MLKHPPSPPIENFKFLLYKIEFCDRNGQNSQFFVPAAPIGNRGKFFRSNSSRSEKESRSEGRSEKEKVVKFY